MSVSPAIQPTPPLASLAPETRLRVVPPGTRVIKRYGNRKLYDLASSRYVKLDEIADLIRAGDDVRVVDHRSGRDITSVALAHIIFGEEVKASKRSAEVLAGVIRGQAAPPPSSDPAVSQPVAEEILDRSDRRLRHMVNQAHRSRAFAQQMIAASDQALERLRQAASAKIEAAHDIVDGLARAKRDLGRIARRVDCLHERLREIDG